MGLFSKKRQNADSDPLYQFEKLSLRNLFFDIPKEFATGFLKIDNYIFYLYEKHCKTINEPLKYNSNDFITKVYSDSNNNIIFKVFLPEPYISGLSYSVQFIYKSNCEPISCVYDQKMDDGVRGISVWTQDSCYFGCEDNEDDYKELNTLNINSFDELIKQQ